jgi:hypothetical protein
MVHEWVESEPDEPKHEGEVAMVVIANLCERDWQLTTSEPSQAWLIHDESRPWVMVAAKDLGLRGLVIAIDTQTNRAGSLILARSRKLLENHCGVAVALLAWVSPSGDSARGG